MVLFSGECCKMLKTDVAQFVSDVTSYTIPSANNMAFVKRYNIDNILQRQTKMCTSKM